TQHQPAVHPFGLLGTVTQKIVNRFLASQIQVVLPGEAVGQWRLEEIDRNTAVFRAGEQTRRLAIP
ncbi:hypothetical protein M3O38_19165, partial [Xanthomonas nasturtii]|nr:hypothetical protein [Xanthomonas nasturtii]MCL1557444.1 hypothetical protein [Xanthomonas nasturtii]